MPICYDDEWMTNQPAHLLILFLSILLVFCYWLTLVLLFVTLLLSYHFFILLEPSLSPATFFYCMLPFAMSVTFYYHPLLILPSPITVGQQGMRTRTKDG